MGECIRGLVEGKRDNNRGSRRLRQTFTDIHAIVDLVAWRAAVIVVLVVRANGRWRGRVGKSLPRRFCGASGSVRWIDQAGGSGS